VAGLTSVGPNTAKCHSGVEPMARFNGEPWCYEVMATMPLCQILMVPFLKCCFLVTEWCKLMIVEAKLSIYINNNVPRYFYQGYQFYFISLGMTEMFHTNSKNETKRNKFHLILNLGSFRIFRLNSTRNVPVSFHMFCSALEKSLNQI